MNEVKKIIDLFKLQPHPEGGYFARVYISDDQVNTISDRYPNATRSAGSAIYYLLNKNQFSAWHRLKSDELWHFYHGSPIIIYILNQAGNLTTNILGDAIEMTGANFQVIIKAGDYFAAEIVDKTLYSLVGCTVHPGFEFIDFELADTAELVKRFPQHEKILQRLSHGPIKY